MISSPNTASRKSRLWKTRKHGAGEGEEEHKESKVYELWSK
jgi:hypothetical protein